MKRPFIWSVLLSLAFMTFVHPVAMRAGSLDANTLTAWDAYLQLASNRMEQRLTPSQTFLWVDERPDRVARVRAGEIVVSPVTLQNTRRVPSGLIHDWISAAFIEHATVKDVLDVVRNYGRYKDFYQPTVIDSRAIAVSESTDRFSMRLINKSLLLSTAFDVDYESCYVQLDAARGYSISRSTRIREIEAYGTADQRLLNEGEGHGFIWRLFSIMRYVERDGGIYIELEAIGLSRDIPASLQWLIEPMVRRIARGSLSTSLRQTESAVLSRLDLFARGPMSAGIQDKRK